MSSNANLSDNLIQIHSASRFRKFVQAMKIANQVAVKTEGKGEQSKRVLYHIGSGRDGVVCAQWVGRLDTSPRDMYVNQGDWRFIENMIDTHVLGKPSNNYSSGRGFK